MLKIKKSISSIIDAFNHTDPSMFRYDELPGLRCVPGFNPEIRMKDIRRAMAYLVKLAECHELRDIPIIEAIGLRPPRLVIERKQGLVMEISKGEQAVMATLLMGLSTPTSKESGICLLDLVSRCNNCRDLFLARTARRAAFCSKKCRNRYGYVSGKKKRDPGA